MKRPLTLKQWAEGYCESRGFTLDFAIKNGAELVDARRAKQLGYSAREGIVFHSRHPFTHELLNSSQIRFHEPLTRTDREGKTKTQKCEVPRGSTYHEPSLCTGIDWQKVAKSTNVPLIFSEGPTRALAGAAHGHAVIALPGVNGHGAGDELPECLSPFKWKGRKVYIAFDADAVSNPEVKRQEVVLARKLAARGAKVYIVRIPAKEPHFGMDDWLGMPGGPESFPALLAAAEPWEPAAEGDPLTVESLSTVEAKDVVWLWEPYLPMCMPSMLSGDPGSGKTSVALDIAASLTNGYIPYTRKRCKPINVLYFSVENAAEYVTAPRFAAQGGNPKRFFTVTDAVTLQQMNRIEATVRKTRAKLVIFDPLQSYLGADVDAHRSNETRPVMDGLVRLAEKYQLVVLIVRHLAKSSGGRAIHRGLGSIDLTAAVRSEMLVGTAPDAPSLRAIVQIKNSVGPHAPSLAFEIVGNGKTAKLEWRGECQLTSADLLAPEVGPKRKTQLDEAREYLREALKDGPKLVREELEGDAPVPLHVLQKASKEMNLRKKRRGEGGPWVWALPNYSLSGGKYGPIQ